MLRRLIVPVLGLALLAGAAHAADKADCKVIIAAEMKVRMADTRAIATVQLNHQDVDMIVDSGAFYSVLNAAAAERLGLRKLAIDPDIVVSGVGGEESIGLVAADTFGWKNFERRNVEFATRQGGFDHAAVGLIGQNIVGAGDVEYDLANGAIRLINTLNCGDRMLAYWAQTTGAGSIWLDPISPLSPKIVGRVTINGKSVRAMFDTGSYRSFITRSAAARLGFKPTNPGVTAGGEVSGIGASLSQSWIAPFESFRIGDEKITNTRLRVSDFEMSDVDMLIGADFFLSHRIYVAHNQHHLYFTYNGGPVFRLDKVPTDPASAAAASSPAFEPVSVDDFARRAAARTSRRDYAGALADWDRVVAAEPKSAVHLYDRALVHAKADQDDLALADLNQAIALDPSYANALMNRGAFLLKRKKLDAAKADFDAAIRAAPDRDTLILTVADDYEHFDLYTQAIAAYDAWIPNHPKSERLADALGNRCWVKVIADFSAASALEDCNAAIKAGPRSSNALDSRGWAYFRLGQYDRALDDFQAALKLQPKLEASLYGRGLCRLAKGQADAGKVDVEAAIAIDAKEVERLRQHGLVWPRPVNP